VILDYGPPARSQSARYLQGKEYMHFTEFATHLEYRYCLRNLSYLANVYVAGDVFAFLGCLANVDHLKVL